MRILSRLSVATVVSVLPLCAVDWEPITEAELAVTEPRLDPEADAEALFWKVWVTDRLLGSRQPQSIKEQYLRVKIFTERGV